MGVTLTFTCDSRLEGPEPPAPKPNVRKLRCFCCRAYGGTGKAAADVLEEEEADLCKRLVMLLDERVLLIEFLGLFWRDEEEFNEIVDWGELFDAPPMNDLEGVECTDELMAA